MMAGGAAQPQPAQSTTLNPNTDPPVEEVEDADVPEEDADEQAGGGASRHR